MNDTDPPGREPRSAAARRRIAAFVLIAVFAALIWAAYSGRFEAEVRQAADWLRQAWSSLTR